MAISLKLTKLEEAKKTLVLNLNKRGVLKMPEAEVAFILDVSGSFDGTHRSGKTQVVLERGVPWGMTFDPDKKLDVFTFSDGEDNAVHVGDVTPESVDHYIANNIIDRVEGYNGATTYHYVIKKALKHFGWLPTEKKTGGFLGFGKKTTQVTGPQRRTIVLFVTDGACSDEGATEQLLADSEQRKDQIYFLFIGINRKESEFAFLKRIGDRFSNTGLTVIKDIDAFNAMNDEQVNNMLINDELVAWLKK